MSGTEFRSIFCPLSAQLRKLFGPQEPASAATAVAAVIARARVVAVQALIRASPAWTTYPRASFTDCSARVHTPTLRYTGPPGFVMINYGSHRLSFRHRDAPIAGHAGGHGRRTGRRRPVWRGPVGQSIAGPDRRVARQGGGAVCAERHDGEPDRPQDPDTAGRRGDPR